MAIPNGLITSVGSNLVDETRKGMTQFHAVRVMNHVTLKRA